MIEIYQVDAFCKNLFSGNPAAVCPLDNWLSDELLQQIAAENNLSETAFYVPTDGGFHIRWFTPVVEVDLCGHATLAAAHVLWNHLGYQQNTLTFFSKSGPLYVTRSGLHITLNFPADIFQWVPISQDMKNWFQKEPVEVYKGLIDYLFVYHYEQDIKEAIPNLQAIAQAKEVDGVIITARGEMTDFVARYFAPRCGVAEDPATGAIYTTLTPYWSKLLGKKQLKAKQLSSREGYFECENLGDRILITGMAKTYMKGVILLP